MLFRKLRKKDKVTSAGELELFANPVVEVTGWGEEKLKIRLRRVELIDLISSGELPNELLAYATDILSMKIKNPLEDASKEGLERFSKLLHIAAEKAMVEPTYAELKEACGGFIGYETLADIWTYCVYGLKGLKFFRRELATRKADRAGSEVLEESSQ